MEKTGFQDGNKAENDKIQDTRQSPTSYKYVNKITVHSMAICAYTGIGEEF